MNNRIKIAFLTMISLQAVHSVEEYIFKFYEVFPPMQFIYRDAPDLAKSGFVTFNLLLFLFGIICFFYWVQPARKGARVVIWVWIAIQLATIASHAIWVMSVGDYHPGLATVPLFVPIVVFMMYLLHHAPTKPPPNKSLDARAKQRLCYRVAWFLSACVVAVSPHVNSAVGRLRLTRNESKRKEI